MTIWDVMSQCADIQYDDDWHSFDIHGLACFTLKDDLLEDRILEIQLSNIDPYIYNTLMSLNIDLGLYTWASCSGLVEDHIYWFPQCYYEICEPYVGFNRNVDIDKLIMLIENTNWVLTVCDHSFFIHYLDEGNDSDTKRAWNHLDEKIREMIKSERNEK